VVHHKPLVRGKPTGVRRKGIITAQSRRRATKPEQQQRYGVLKLLKKRIEKGKEIYLVHWESTWELTSSID